MTQVSQSKPVTKKETTEHLNILISYICITFGTYTI